MQITNFNSAQFSKAYDIHCSPMESLNFKEGLYPTLCKVEVGGKTRKHSHFEPEVFYIVKGTGVLQIETTIKNVGPGDLIRIPPFSIHELTNMGNEEIHFLSVYSADYQVSKLPNELIITVAPPTPNGPLHLGHISGPYLGSDVLARYMRSKGTLVTTHSGTDDHQNYVAERALDLGLDTEIFRLKMRERIKAGLKSFAVDFESFVEPKKDEEYQKQIFTFFQRAKDAKVIEMETVHFPYCEDCDIHLIDARIDGNCPHCHEASRGGCENCGFVCPPYELLNKSCARCSKPAGSKLEQAFTFSLGQHLPKIKNELDRLELSPRLRKLVNEVEKLKETKVLLTYPSSKEDIALNMSVEKMSLHVWFEMAAHYEQFATNSKPWVHCFGFDNAFYYLLFIPALLKSLHDEAKLPDSILSNEFLHLEGKKFSTSRNHAIWADEFQGNTDHLRLYLCQERPTNQTSDFTLASFKSFSEELEQKLTKLNHRARELSRMSEEANQKITVLTHRFIHDLDYVMSSGHFNLRQGSRMILNHLDLILESEGQIGNEKLLIRTWAYAVGPFMPLESEILLTNLGER